MKEPIAANSSSSTQVKQTGRLFFLDLLKALSITAVVSYHSVFVPQSTYAANGLLLEALFAPLRFCVPVLLTISFLLFERGLASQPTTSIWPPIKKRLFRLAIPTLFWFSLAAGLKFLTGNPPVEVISDIFKGTIFTGAYYLLIMLQFVPLFIWGRRWLNQPRNILASILAQGFIFLFLYASLLGVFGTQIIPVLKTIDRPLFIYWFAYIAIGVGFYKSFPWLVKTSARISVQLKVLSLFLIGLLLIAESSWLFLSTGGSIPPFDYAMFSCLLSVPVAFLCFACVEETQVSLPLRRAVGLLSKYSLGIFCVNGIASQILLSFGSKWFSEFAFSFPEILTMKLVGWVLLLAVSLGVSVLIDRIGWKSLVC